MSFYKACKGIQHFLNFSLSGISNDGSTVQYGTLVRYASIFAKKYGTLVWYVFFVIVRVRYALFEKARYVGTLFPDFLHIALAFCMQGQKTVETDAK